MQALKGKSVSPENSSTERILAAAEKLFSEHGYDAVSINAIAVRAGVSKANIFHHFNTKNELYLAVVKDACKETQTRVQTIARDHRSIVDRLSHFAQAQLQFMLEHGQTTRLILRELIKNGPERGRELAEQVFGQSFARLVGMIREGQAQGELRQEVDPAAIAVMLVAINIYYFEAREMLRHYPDVDFADDPERYIQKMLKLMLNGILPNTQEKNNE